MIIDQSLSHFGKVDILVNNAGLRELSKSLKLLTPNGEM
ncbi:MAG: hypothetical protein CM1200mP38_5050 [Dehalococcoidia bacterium]|nr:MAG: hypothetical protein CM1200mP38_5050 [Dehalococcoidia bacterium]